MIQILKYMFQIEGKIPWIPIILGIMIGAIGTVSYIKIMNNRRHNHVSKMTSSQVSSNKKHDSNHDGDHGSSEDADIDTDTDNDDQDNLSDVDTGDVHN